MDRFHPAREVVLGALATRAFPGGVVEVGTADRVAWREAFGRLTYAPAARPARDDTVFDLASLTKVIATTTLVMRLLERRLLDLDDPIRRWLPDWRGPDREMATVSDLLAHASGLPAWLPLYRNLQGRDAFARAISAVPLEYAPRTRSVYSDLGFVLLGFVLERAAGRSLDEQFERFLVDAGLASDSPLLRVAFSPPEAWRDETAPTEADPWRNRLLVGEVHDENAAALGGVAGHAGLFGTAAAVGAFARLVMQARRERPEAVTRLAQAQTVVRFTTRTTVPASSRALGWDTMLPTSSCGTRLSASAFGHTGFTGTSLWIDPVRDLYVVFLTNRVHPSRDNDAIQQVRPALHDAIAGFFSP